jgi:hypothetical protein
MRLVRAAIIGVALCACACGAGAQASQPGTGAASETSVYGRPRFMLYLFEAESGSVSSTERFILYNSILTAAAQANPDVVVMESPDSTVPDTVEGRKELARRVNADCWLSASETGGLSNLTIQVETYDILRDQAFGTQVIRPGFVVDYRAISAGFWDELTAAIKGSYARVVDRTPLKVTGVPGTELSGIPGGPFHIGPDGAFEQEIPYPSSFTLTARAAGYYDAEQALSVGITPLSVALPQEAEPSLGVELRLSSFQFPGARLWWYVIPAEVFARLGITTELFGFYPIDNTPNVFVTGAPLSLLELDAGLYISPAESFLRFFLGIGGYLRICHPPAPRFGLDTDGAPGAVTASLGLEYSPWRKLRFVVEYEPALILASNPQQFINVTFVPNSFPSGSVPGYIVLPWGLLDLRNLYLGLRLDF